MPIKMTPREQLAFDMGVAGSYFLLSDSMLKRAAQLFTEGKDAAANEIRVQAKVLKHEGREKMLDAHKRAGLCCHVQQAGETLWDICGLPAGHPTGFIGDGHSYLSPFWDHSSPLE